MEKHIEEFLKGLKEQQDEIAKYLFGKSDVEVTCKMVFENVPTSFAYSEEGRKAIEDAKQQFEESVADIENAKCSIKVKIKDKPLTKSEKEKPKKSKKKGVKND